MFHNGGTNQIPRPRPQLFHSPIKGQRDSSLRPYADNPLRHTALRVRQSVHGQVGPEAGAGSPSRET